MWVQYGGADGVTVVRVEWLMQTIEAGFRLFEWQYDVIVERNAVRSVFLRALDKLPSLRNAPPRGGVVPLRHPLPDRGSA